MNTKIALIVSSFITFLSTFGQINKPGKTEKPNILIIYADDVGYGDLSCYGAKLIKTPNLDAIAANGVRFTNAYASSAMCSPSRFSMLTGSMLQCKI